MSSLEDRIRRIEDKQELQELFHRYCFAVDSLSDLDGLLDCFTEDAKFDLSGIGLPVVEGHAAIRAFFTQVFHDMTHHAHYGTNFHVRELGEDTASVWAYVMGMGNSRDGNSVLVYVKYFLEYQRTAAGWKLSRFGESALMPLPGSLAEIHVKD